ncbi:transcriptional regulator [Pseudomonas siliginis]|uniref:transcriptional regulator n=1 Tax=Pseudomonas siliginis TaxID=2842346 RepID=UPI001C3DF7A4|nr:helix-turn-helix domain-containing protein [Pseudomonas siliginis]
MTYCVKDAELCRQALDKVITICGNNQSELARRCNVKQPHVWKWVKAGRVPTERVHAVARASHGKVLPHELRPDLPDLFPAPAIPAAAA